LSGFFSLLYLQIAGKGVSKPFSFAYSAQEHFRNVVKFMTSLPAKIRAEELHRLALETDEAGQPDAAIELYLQAIAEDPLKAASFFNIGLIHKRRREWQPSFAFNRRAHELNPEDQAARWNLAIAATALRDWETARRIWALEGITLKGEGPIDDNFGMNPVRLNPEDNGEVVWGLRIDPVRIRIENIPLPGSGFHYRDVVLHDGEPVGYRLFEGREYAVFNALELFEASDYATFEADIDAPSKADVSALEDLFAKNACHAEDWGGMRWLCRACSEGRPHEHADAITADGDWKTERSIGIASRSAPLVEQLLLKWEKRRGCRVHSLRQAPGRGGESDDGRAS
jgi:tetratricopeptide (TPR) repeat protein